MLGRPPRCEKACGNEQRHACCGGHAQPRARSLRQATQPVRARQALGAAGERVQGL